MEQARRTGSIQTLPASYGTLSPPAKQHPSPSAEADAVLVDTRPVVAHMMERNHGTHVLLLEEVSPMGYTEMIDSLAVALVRNPAAMVEDQLACAVYSASAQVTR